MYAPAFQPFAPIRFALDNARIGDAALGNAACLDSDRIDSGFRLLQHPVTIDRSDGGVAIAVEDDCWDDALARQDRAPGSHRRKRRVHIPGRTAGEP